jgi:hypothetical protein
MASLSFLDSNGDSECKYWRVVEDYKLYEKRCEQYFFSSSSFFILVVLKFCKDWYSSKMLFSLFELVVWSETASGLLTYFINGGLGRLHENWRGLYEDWEEVVWALGGGCLGILWSEIASGRLI